MKRLLFILTIILFSQSIYASENDLVSSTGANSQQKKRTNTKTLENNGDIDWIFESKVFTNTTTTNNAFGVVKSNFDRSIDAKVSQRWTQWVKPYLFFGQNIVDLNLPFGNYTNVFFFAGLGTEINPTKRFKLNFNTEFGNSLLFRSKGKIPVGYISLNSKTIAEGMYSIIQTNKLDLSLGGGVIFCTPLPKYGVTAGTGAFVKAQGNIKLGKLILQSAVYSQFTTFHVDQNKQILKENGLLMNIGWDFPFKSPKM